MRTLTIEIIPEYGSVAEIVVRDNDTKCKKTFYVGGYNSTDEKAQDIGYDIMSWAEMELMNFQLDCMETY